VSAGLPLSKLRPEHPMLTLIELVRVKKKHEKQTLACKGDTLPASHASALARGNVVWAVLPSYGKG
jgi:hypothetical protein